MNVHLVAADEALYKECREILGNVPEARLNSTPTNVDSDDRGCDADLHVWNFHPDLAVPEGVQWNPLRHIFLVDRKDLALFRERTGTLEGSILLKPMGPGSLETFLLAALSRVAAKSLRAERDEILQCLIQTNLKVQESDHQRTTFVARAVHDFHSPLTALSGYCGLLLGEPLGPLTESQNEVLRRMQMSAKHLSRIVSAMDALSACRDAERHLELEPANLGESLEQALSEITPFADEKAIAITVDLEPCGDGLYFEAAQIEQVLLNLLDSACRFTPRTGSIEIRGSQYFWERRSRQRQSFSGVERRAKNTREPNSYRLDIADTGAAIPEELLATIFEEHASYAGACDRSGGGLGLAICKKIISQHQGRIWAENHDGGPIFSFVLPSHTTDPRFPIPGEVAGLGSHLRGRRDAD